MENSNDRISLKQVRKILDVEEAQLDGSTFEMMMMNNASFHNVRLHNLKINDADLSNLEISAAQLGGAYIHDIGMPPKGHPAYNEEAAQKPLRFKDCDFHDSTIINCNLSGIVIDDCNISGMIINGILLDDLLIGYNKNKL